MTKVNVVHEELSSHLLNFGMDFTTLMTLIGGF